MSMYAPIHQAIRALAGMDPDFAQQQNGVGFNKPDTTMGHTLAALPELCDRDAYIAYHLLRKYARQLSNYGISFDQLPVPLEPPNDFFMTIAYHEPGVNFKKAFIVAFEYDQEKITALKSSVNGNSQFASKGAAKFWEVKAHKGVIAALKEFAIEYEFEITKGAHDAMTAIESAPDTTDDTVPTEENYRTISEGRDRYNRECFYVRFPYNPALSEELKIVCRGTGWSGAPLKVWMVPTIREEQLMEWGKRHNFRIDIEGYTPRAELEARRIAEWVELSESALEILGPLEEFRFNDHALYKHQREGIELMIKRGRMILADDMGLGKTLQTLAAAKAFQIAHGYAVFVLAPVSLHRNWVREAQAVEVSIEVYSWAKVPEPPAQTPFILICDEAHYAQNLLSKRTEGFLKLAENAKAVYLATGTPMKNGRPSNLFPLLKAIKHPLALDKAHYDRHYCAAKATRYSKWDTTGAAHLDELHELTKDAMLRRLKKNCLDLPAKTRVWRDVDFSAEAQAEYDRVYVAARREYTDRLVSGEILSGAEALVLLTHMRRATSIGKVETTIELVEELLEEDRQVVVFTDFKESAHKIAAHFKVPAMTGDMRAVENNSEVAKNLRALWDRYEQGEELTDEELYALKVATTRQDYVDAFQAGKMKVFVGTIKAGGVGITLTAADTVILHDRALTPGDAVQAEDRLHRIGQHKNVTAIWLQATDTDRKIDDLLVAKQQRIELVLAGKRKTMRGIDSIYDVAKEAIHEIFG